MTSLKTALIAVLSVLVLGNVTAMARPYQGPGCGPPGVYGCGGSYQIPYQGPDRGPPGYYGYWPYPRPYAGPGNGPPGYYSRHHRYYRD